MKRSCIRCCFEGSLSDKTMRFNTIIHEWLCDDCFELLYEEFERFKDEFINLNNEKKVLK